MTNHTSPTNDNAEKSGHLPTGKFAPGNKFGVGNPFHKKTHALRASLFQTVSEDDLIKVTKKLIAMAKSGNIHAIRELFDRVLGRPLASVELTAPDLPITPNGDLSDDQFIDRIRSLAARVRVRLAAVDASGAERACITHRPADVSADN